jgi:anti-sigma factor RsiW
MDCKEFRELLDLYVDGELSTEATFSARAHLQGCSACGRVEQQMVRLRAAIKRLVNEREPPSELRRKVRLVGRPGWQKFIPGMRLEPPTVIDGGETKASLWHKKIALPVPAFAVILLAASGLGGLIALPRSGPPSPSNPAGVRKAVPESPGNEPMTKFDLTQFDKGGRAAIYKVRSSDYTDLKQ